MERKVTRRFGDEFYQRFFQMPVPAVLAVMWLLGMAIVTACLLALYVLVAPLVGV